MKPEGPIFTGTYKESQAFNIKFKEGNESISFWVPEFDLPHVTDLVKQGGKLRLMDYAATFLGRWWDRYRCTDVALRLVGSRLECRIQFGPPWWYKEAEEEWQKKNA